MMRYIRYMLPVLMILSLAYSIVIYRVGSGTFSFLIWIFGAIIFGVFFYISGNGLWMKIPFGVRCTGYVTVGLSLIFFFICFAAMISHFKDKGEGNLDYIIVLGAQMKGGSPSTIYRFRLDAAYEYLTMNPDTICIVSGGKGKNETVSEGDGGREYLVSKGIDPGRIIAETKAADTVENITFSTGLMDRTSKQAKMRVGIVSSNFHVFRGVHLAKGYTENYVCGIASYTVPLYLPNNMVRECFGILRDLSKMK